MLTASEPEPLLLEDPPDLPEKKRSGPSTGRRAVVWVLSGVVTVVWAALCNYALDVSAWSGTNHPWSAALETSARYLDLLVVLVVVLLVLAVVGRLWLTLGITGLVTVALAMSNAEKLALRNDPIYPSDTAFLTQPGFLAEMVGGSKLVLGAIAAVVVVLVAWGVGRLMSKPFPYAGKGLTTRGRWLLRGVRVAVAVVCLTLLVSATGFNHPGNRWRSAYDGVVDRWRPWDQRRNYQLNGFVAGLLYNAGIEAMKEPKGYSAATMAEISERYRRAAAQLNRGRTGDLANVNVVTVLSESFSDPTWLKTVHWASSPIPMTEALMKHTLSGRLLTPGYGSGTSNVEFELLTGQSMSQFSPQLQLAYDRLVSRYSSYPSLVSWFGDRGHHTVAIHPFSFRMYKRVQVFDAFGFDQTVDKDSMAEPFRQDGGRFISDAAAFGEVEHQIATQDEPVFAHLITMQNHMPYRGQYDDPVLPASGLSGSSSKVAGQYARGLTLSDKALAGFLADVRKSSEPTVVVYYGDHLPPEIFPANVVRREGVRATHETPWLIWSNQKQLPPRTLPTMSPTQLMPLLFDATDTPVPPYVALLDALRAQLPAMDAGLMVDGADRVTSLKHLSTAQRQVLDDYRMVQYDLSIGKRYSEKALFGDPPR